MPEATTGFTTMQRRVVNWDVDEMVVEEEAPKAPPAISVAPAPARPATPETSSLRVGQTDKSLVAEPKPKVTRNRTGNGHTPEFKRKLNDTERAFFRSSFLRKDGRFEEDGCVTLKSGVHEDVAIFQVTGFISYLHREVAQGRIELRDLHAYLNWMHTKYEGLWSQYNNPRFTAVRLRNQQARRQGQAPSVTIPFDEVPIQQFTKPKFKAFPRRGSYHRG